MEELTEIVKNINSGEIRLIRKFYKIGEENDNLKRLELFNLINKGKVSTNEEAIKKLYNSSKVDSKFSHLKTRLKNDILNIILYHEGERKYITPFRQATFDCRKLILKSDILLSRGANKAGLNLLNKAEQIASKYELPAEQVVISDMLRSHLGIRKGMHEYEKYKLNIDKQLNLLNDIFEAKDLYNHILLPNIFYKNKEKEYISMSASAVSKLENIFYKSKSSQIGFLYYYIAIYYHELGKEFDKSLKFALKLLDLVKNNPSIYAPNRIAGTYLQIANLNLKIGNYIETINHGEEALKIFRKGIINELVTMELLFFAHLYSKHFDKTDTIIEKAINHKTVKENEFYQGKWQYFMANNKFFEKKFHESLNILRQNTYLAKDKSGWFVGWNLLELLNLIEMEEFDLFYYRFDAFKLLVRKQKIESPRIHLILNILENLIKSNFNFKITNTSNKSDLELLMSQKSNYVWDPLGFEIARFDQWFLSKIN